jgi:hypothetical protein
MWTSLDNMEENVAEPWIALRVRAVHGRANTSTMRTPSGPLGEPLPHDFVPKIYQGRGWDVAPIVIEEYKLLFFTQGKVRLDG